MNLAEDIRLFVKAANAARTINALAGLTARAVARLGFEHFALLHHVDIYRGGGDTVFLHNFPDEWAATVHVHSYLPDDPVLEICKRQSAPFLWSDIPSLIDLSPRQREILRQARHAGLAHGYSVPIHAAGEPVGSCSFTSRAEPNAAAQAAVMSIGIFAFDAARKLLSRGRRAPAAGRPRLTPRERDCILHAGRGLNDAQTSELLGIPEAAVSRHIEDARRKYGAATAMELIVRALYRAELTFADLIDVEDELSGKPLTRRGEASLDEPAPMSRLGALFFGTNPDLN
jgi:DNA-binding CsgD family transcriptional regulator